MVNFTLSHCPHSAHCSTHVINHPFAAFNATRAYYTAPTDFPSCSIAVQHFQTIPSPPLAVACGPAPPVIFYHPSLRRPERNKDVPPHPPDRPDLFDRCARPYFGRPASIGPLSPPDTHTAPSLYLYQPFHRRPERNTDVCIDPHDRPDLSFCRARPYFGRPASNSPPCPVVSFGRLNFGATHTHTHVHANTNMHARTHARSTNSRTPKHTRARTHTHTHAARPRDLPEGAGG